LISSGALLPFHHALVQLFGLSGITLLPFVLYADSSSYGGSSGYEAGSNRSSFLTEEPGEEYRRFGNMIPGMSYQQVQIERAHIYVTILNKMRTSNACLVIDVLAHCTPNTHKLIEYGYREAKLYYSPDSVLATKTFDGRGTSLSPAALKIQDLNRD